MTARRMKNKQTSVAASWRRGRRVASGNARPKERNAPREKKRFIQLMACGTIFVLLVAAKLLLPGKMGAVNEAISQALQQNIDVQAVFSAVGETFSKETNVQDAMGEVYRAVFSPQKTEIEQTAAAVTELPEKAALQLLQQYRQAEQEAVSEPEVSNLAYVLYSDENLPEDVALEPKILGFEYCSPVSGVISSEFGYRDHPTEGEERFHYGLDLAANTGTAVCCFADGVVTAVGESSSYGKYCVVSHENGYSTLYAHCSRITASSGTTVSMGAKIAEVGETGMATGPHLHFELQCEGDYLNPIYYVSEI